MKVQKCIICNFNLLYHQGFMQDKIIASHVTHVLVDTWMLTLKCLPEIDYKHTCDTIFTHFQGITNNIYGFGRPFIFLLLHFTRPLYFYPSIFVFTRPNDGWTGLYIKLFKYHNQELALKCYLSIKKCYLSVLPNKGGFLISSMENFICKLHVGLLHTYLIVNKQHAVM